RCAVRGGADAAEDDVGGHAHAPAGSPGAGGGIAAVPGLRGGAARRVDHAARRYRPALGGDASGGVMPRGCGGGPAAPSAVARVGGPRRGGGGSPAMADGGSAAARGGGRGSRRRRGRAAAGIGAMIRAAVPAVGGGGGRPACGGAARGAGLGAAVWRARVWPPDRPGRKMPDGFWVFWVVAVAVWGGGRRR